MENRYQIYKGKDVTKEMYLVTWELDNTIFEKKDLLTKKTALDWFKYSDQSTIILWLVILLHIY